MPIFVMIILSLSVFFISSNFLYSRYDSRYVLFCDDNLDLTFSFRPSYDTNRNIISKPFHIALFIYMFAIMNTKKVTKVALKFPGNLSYLL